MDMKPKLLTFCLVLSVLLNIAVSGFVIFTVKSNSVFTGDYPTEDINLIARLHRVNYLGWSLTREIKTVDDRDLPVIISELAQNPNPKAIVFGDQTMYIMMDSRSLNGLTKEETRAVIAHEIGHYMLKHTPEPDINKEIAADIFALDYVERDALAEAILKLSHYDEEKRVRLKAIEEH